MNEYGISCILFFGLVIVVNGLVTWYRIMDDKYGSEDGKSEENSEKEKTSETVDKNSDL